MAVAFSATGCTSAPSASAAFCSTFESAWNGYADSRTTDVTSGDEYAAHHDLVSRWNAAMSSGIASETADILRLAEDNLLRARIDAGPTARAHAATYLWNGLDTVAATCKSKDFTVSLTGRELDLSSVALPQS